jgi:hypothetical protein
MSIIVVADSPPLHHAHGISSTGLSFRERFLACAEYGMKLGRH